MNEIKTSTPQSKLVAFENRKIRRIWHNEEWFFSVVDVVAALTDSADAGAYWRKLKQRLQEEGSEVVTFCHGLKLEAPDGKQRATDCANTEGLFRIIQAIPSPKAEPFKRWLAKVGYERVQEIEDPEKAAQRMRELYKAKGYPEEWIERRMRGIAIREELTDEWKKHGVKESKEYEILTAEIAKTAFGVTPSEHKHLKGLQRENLRDHMTDLELIFSMLGEAATTAITKKEHPQGFVENKKVSKRGGNVAGEARRKLEKETGQKVVSTENYLDKTATEKKLGSSVEPFPQFTPAAKKRWEAIPESFRARVLNNVWCGRCRGTVTIRLEHAEMEKGLLVLHGSCASCGDPVNRVIEEE